MKGDILYIYGFIVVSWCWLHHVFYDFGMKQRENYVHVSFGWICCVMVMIASIHVLHCPSRKYDIDIYPHKYDLTPFIMLDAFVAMYVEMVSY